MKSKGKGGEKRQHNACYETLERESFSHLLSFLERKLIRKMFPSGTARQGTSNQCPALFFLSSFKCSNVQMFFPSYFRVPCSSVLPSRVKIRIFTLIELLIVIAIITIRLNSFF